jgi:hypothetical protein
MGPVDLPPLAVAASNASMGAQRMHSRGTLAYLGLLVAAAVFGAIRYRPDPASLDYSALAALVCFVLAALVAGFLASTRPDRTWYDGRAAAESVKTLAWRYAVGGNPFPLPGSDGPADAFFAERLKEIIKTLRYVNLGTGTAAPQITPWMRASRSASSDERRRCYEVGRIEEQQTWYSTRASWNERRASKFALAGLGLTALGVLLALGRAVGVIDADLLGVVSASAAALTAWLQVKQHEALARAYAVAAHELGTIRSLIGQSESGADWARFVDAAEEAISREHTLWLASRGLEKS